MVLTSPPENRLVVGSVGEVAPDRPSTSEDDQTPRCVPGFLWRSSRDWNTIQRTKIHLGTAPGTSLSSYAVHLPPAHMGKAHVHRYSEVIVQVVCGWAAIRLPDPISALVSNESSTM
jgi:uncharacterized RmlC-like cupin family protein